MENSIEKILSIGEPLIEEGINNWALTRHQVMEVVPRLMLESIAINGGDLLIRENGRFHYTYNNWYSQKKTGESWNAFVKRSINDTILFMNRIEDKYNEPFFKLVIQAKGLKPGESRGQPLTDPHEI